MYNNPDQPTGVSLIAAERQEQIVKHGFSVQNDSEYYSNNELLVAADFCIHETNYVFPEKWDEKYAKKIKAKDRIGQLKVAGAFIAAEIDRMLYEAIPRCEYCGMIQDECICDDKTQWTEKITGDLNNDR